MSEFGEATRVWFERSFPRPTAIQARGWEAVAKGQHTLMTAPTGSGKTLAAFLWGIDRLTRLPVDAASGVRLLYVSPLKALVYDVERNLRAPLVGIQRTAEQLDLPLREIRVDLRTGDTPQKDRQRQARQPADILVTTPESLYLLLASKARETLRGVHTVIVDEVHALAPTKRGVHLALTLERLARLASADPQRIGLSATVRPAEEVARFLGGDRVVEIVDASKPPALDLQVCVPVPDMDKAPPPDMASAGGSVLAAPISPDAAKERGIWPAIYPRILDRILGNRSTIVFVNNRGLCERLAQRINELADEELVWAHHGSVSHQKRVEIEDGLKTGRVRGIIATSSLELGIDMGAVDLVILVESPGSVTRGLQRVGRAGHRVEATSTGCIFPKFRGDLLECAVITQRMLTGSIESIRVPANALDVLAQQIAAICIDQSCTVKELTGLVRRAFPFQGLTEDAMHAVLDMLSGRYPSSDFADLKPLLSWDRTTDTLSARRGTAMRVRLNAGTIPDRGNYAVYLGEDGKRLGELDEEMVFESRVGDVILLGATAWRIEAITRDRVLVSPAPGEPGKLPFWRGEGPGRPLELGQALGAFVRKIGAMTAERATQELLEQTPLDGWAAANLASYVHAQREHTGSLPTDRVITIERFRDELGDWRICILTPFGAAIHGPWAMAIQHRLEQTSEFETQVMYTDDGIVLRFADAEELPGSAILLPDPDTVEEAVTEQLAGTALFAGLFRENAARALLLTRRRPDQRTPLWAQRLKSNQLLATVQRYPDFPLVLETYRQCLRDVFDLPGLKEILRGLQSRQIRAHEVETGRASPFARSLVFAYVAAYIYEQDSPLAERRAQALTLDRHLLADLLGQAELRELIDAEVLATLEEELQCLQPDRRARDADELHDLLRRLGDLSTSELKERCAADPIPWLETLTASGRAVVVPVAGEQRWLAAEDIALFRDALGVMPPPGLPEVFLDLVERPLEHLVLRYGRCHGPFTTLELARRFGLRPAQVEPALRLCEREQRLVRGELRPGGTEPEWCDNEVFRQLKRRTLAKLRRQVVAVDTQALGRFLPRWQRVGGSDRGVNALEEVLAQLEGLALPWSLLLEVVLPVRIADFRAEQLDLLCASGALVWIGRGALGQKDGRVALYRREQVATLLESVADETPEDPVHASIHEHLRTRGASFLVELEAAVRGAHAGLSRAEFEAALWDLVWAGRITNDTVQPLRQLGGPASRAARGRGRRAGALAGGRWSLVSQLTNPDISATVRVVARTEMLLARYGIVSREAALAEDLPGGFSPIYRALKAMEDTGAVRRGYYVEGLSGAQFARPGVVDRLREGTTDSGDTDQAGWQILAAADPANVFGSLLPWPVSGGGDDLRPRRVPGSWVILLDGEPVLYVAQNGAQLMTFPRSTGGGPDLLTQAFQMLHGLPRSGRRRLMVVRKIDSLPVLESPHLQALRDAGFVSDYRGLTPAPGSQAVTATAY